MAQPPMGGGVDDRKTPHDLFDRWNAEHHFTLDAAAAHDNALLNKYCTVEGTYDFREGSLFAEDGLAYSWAGERVFFNPPYSQPEKPCEPGCTKERCMPWGNRGYHLTEQHTGLFDFVRKAWYETIELAHCPLAVGLLPVRTEQDWWFGFVWNEDRNRPHDGVTVRFLRGRLKFDELSAGAPFPSVLVEWRPVVVAAPRVPRGLQGLLRRS